MKILKPPFVVNPPTDDKQATIIDFEGTTIAYVQGDECDDECDLFRANYIARLMNTAAGASPGSVLSALEFVRMVSRMKMGELSDDTMDSLIGRARSVAKELEAPCQ